MRTINILWTGGFDSTFRIAQLSRKELIIQPYYISDERQSEANELNAIETISNKLRQNQSTKAIINPLIYISKDRRRTNPEIESAYAELRKQDFMGSQYEWLACFAEDHPHIEMSIHKDDKAINLILKHGRLKRIDDEEIGSYYVIDTVNSPAALTAVFGNMHFPLANYTKLDMKKEYAAMGLSEIVDMTWFCFRPINGKPCGICNPCKYTIEEGMIERFDRKALLRYNLRKSKVYRFCRFIKRACKNCPGENSIAGLPFQAIQSTAPLHSPPSGV